MEVLRIYGNQWQVPVVSPIALCWYIMLSDRELGDIRVGVFRKLMASLVESTMLYEAEIWECNRDLEKMEQNQVRALRLFFGVGTLFFRMFHL